MPSPGTSRSPRKSARPTPASITSTTHLAARIDDVNNTIDETNARIDALTADMNAQFDRLDAKMEARFDQMFTLLQGTLQEHGRRLDAIERRLAETVPLSGEGATP